MGSTRFGDGRRCVRCRRLEGVRQDRQPIWVCCRMRGGGGHVIRRLLALVAAAAAIPAVSFASAPRLDVRASLKPVGCTTSFSGSVVTVSGCSASAPFAGTSRGRLDATYSATVDLTRGQGAQRGVLTLRGAGRHDVLVLRFSGRVTVSTGLSRGTWNAVKRGGAFAQSAPRTGTYSSRTPDQGVHVSFVVRG
jgi:adhesin HecA-like repeat protein